MDSLFSLLSKCGRSSLVHRLQHQADSQEVQGPSMAYVKAPIPRTFCFMVWQIWTHTFLLTQSASLPCKTKPCVQSLSFSHFLTVHEHGFGQEQPCTPCTRQALPFFLLPSRLLLLLSCSISFHFYYFRPQVFHLIFCNRPVVF